MSNEGRERHRCQHCGNYECEHHQSNEGKPMTADSTPTYKGFSAYDADTGDLRTVVRFDDYCAVENELRLAKEGIIALQADLKRELAQREGLREALVMARNCIALELEGWIDVHGPDTKGLYMAKVLTRLNAALAAHE